MSLFKPTRWNILFTIVLLIPLMFLFVYFSIFCTPLGNPGGPAISTSSPRGSIWNPVDIFTIRPCSLISYYLGLLESHKGSVFFVLGFIFLLSYILASLLAKLLKKQRLTRYVAIICFVLLSMCFVRLYYLSIVTGYSFSPYFDRRLLPLFLSYSPESFRTSIPGPDGEVSTFFIRGGNLNDDYDANGQPILKPQQIYGTYYIRLSPSLSGRTAELPVGTEILLDFDVHKVNIQNPLLPWKKVVLRKIGGNIPAFVNLYVAGQGNATITVTTKTSNQPLTPTPTLTYSELPNKLVVTRPEDKTDHLSAFTTTIIDEAEVKKLYEEIYVLPTYAPGGVINCPAMFSLVKYSLYFNRDNTLIAYGVYQPSGCSSVTLGNTQARDEMGSSFTTDFQQAIGLSGKDFYGSLK